jgi:NAD(P)-dependent dehydrogenase (short-subunit alcohol dehydrogenase family)
MIKWMVRRGAKNVVIVSRSERISEKVATVIADAKEHGATVVVRRCDVADSQDVDRLVKEVTSEMPTIRGMIHSAMVLDVSDNHDSSPTWS